jgi:hypothetical protein
MQDSNGNLTAGVDIQKHRRLYSYIINDSFFIVFSFVVNTDFRQRTTPNRLVKTTLYAVLTNCYISYHPLLTCNKTKWNISTLHIFFYYYYLVCEAIGTAATPGLLCQPRVIMKLIVEKQMECRLAGGTEVLGENLPQRHFCPSQNTT